MSRQALRGDPDSFLELFRRHEAGLTNMCHRLTGSRHDAADLVQESFLRVFARLDALQGGEVNLAAYLRRTARNLAYDRAQANRGEVMVDDIEHDAGRDHAMETDPELSLLVADQQAMVRRANATLPERHRLALALRELEEMDYAQIGEVLETTPDAVAQILVRARLGLRRALRFQTVDEERMHPDCRARLASIGALIDGQLDEDRARVLEDHLRTCRTCRGTRKAFLDARERYRAWLPLPLIAGLGTQTLHAAHVRGLLQPLAGAVYRGGAAVAGRAAAAGSSRARRPRTRPQVTAGVAAAGLTLAAIAGLSALSMVGSDGASAGGASSPAVTAPSSVTTSPAAPAPAPAPTTTAAAAVTPVAGTTPAGPAAAPRRRPASTGRGSASTGRGSAAPAQPGRVPATPVTPATTTPTAPGSPPRTRRVPLPTPPAAPRGPAAVSVAGAPEAPTPPQTPSLTPVTTEAQTPSPAPVVVNPPEPPVTDPAGPPSPPDPAPAPAPAPIRVPPGLGHAQPGGSPPPITRGTPQHAPTSTTPR